MRAQQNIHHRGLTLRRHGQKHFVVVVTFQLPSRALRTMPTMTEALMHPTLPAPEHRPRRANAFQSGPASANSVAPIVDSQQLPGLRPRHSSSVNKRPRTSRNPSTSKNSTLGPPSREQSSLARVPGMTLGIENIVVVAPAERKRVGKSGALHSRNARGTLEQRGVERLAAPLCPAGSRVERHFGRYCAHSAKARVNLRDLIQAVQHQRLR